MKLNDTRQFMSVLTPSKVWNMLLVFMSYYLSRWFRKPMQWGLPFNISVEPTTNCNLGCPECPSGLKQFTRPTGNLQWELFQKLIDETHSHLVYLYFYFQGEPYIHPLFLKMVRYASDLGIYTVTSTNAHYLTERKARETIESGLSRILISIDGTTQDVYEQYRVGGTLEKVLEGTRLLVEQKRKLNSPTPHIVFQFLVVRPNEHQIEEVYRLAKEIGVDEVKLKTAQIYDYENGSDLIPTISKYSRYRQQSDGKYRIKNKLLNQCWKLWHSCVVTWDGKVVPCCFDKDAKYAMGDVSNRTFKQIWENDSYNRFRKSILVSRSQIDICTNCSEGTKVWT